MSSYVSLPFLDGNAGWLQAVIMGMKTKQWFQLLSVLTFNIQSHTYIQPCSSFLVIMTAEKLGTFTPVLNPSSLGFCFNLSYLLQRSPESWALIHPLTEYLYFVPK